MNALDHYTSHDVHGLIYDAHRELEDIADSLFNARTMTKDERHKLGGRINAARVKMNTALLKIEAA